MENAKEVKIYFGAMMPPDEGGKRRHIQDAWYFADEGYISPWPASPPFDNEEQARAAAKAYCERQNDRYVVDG